MSVGITNYLSLAVMSFLIGLVFGAVFVIAFRVRCKRQQKVKKYHFRKENRFQLSADRKILDKGRRDHATENYH